ncbi:MAG TPA: ATP-dependent Clp protease ATP-binding subunit [Polyangiaceae bacterium]|jgi:ATP-dependent Clp protease ATP-binding subunit ClpC|nr:ATP-dependent Clp protease ATP-binding subunit [Polyangiaceae bacterium]
MKSIRKEPELVALRKLAEQLAGARKERVTSAHLLAAIASRESPASDLLAERALNGERLLRAARASTDDEADPLRRAVERAREIGARMGAPEPVGVHLLIALLSERKSAGHRALDQCGVDVNKLRVAAMNVGLGLVGRRRIVTRHDEMQAGNAIPAYARRPSGTTVPLVPVRAPKPSPKPPQLVEEPVPALEPAAQAPEPRPARRPSRIPSSPSASRFFIDPKKAPTLAALGQNLTLAAELGELDPVVGRDSEIEQALDVLAKRLGNNPCLVGTAGVGKTSVVRGLAARIASAEDVATLDDRIIIEMSVTDLLAGTGIRGALSQRFAAIRKEVLAAGGRIVLFFDEIHQLFAGDAADEISADLKVALARGELPCIGATTLEEYKRAIEVDAALARRFSLVEIEEPSREDAYLVLDALAPSFEKHHGVRYAEDALALAVGWSVRYLPGRALPDKAVSIVDLAGARARRRGGIEVTAEVIAEVVSEMADVPVERLLETDKERMLRLEELLAERVVGHAPELTRIARILRRNAAGLGSRRPIGTFLLLGPTGVGKTETAKAVADVLFFDENAMTRLDLSEYSEAHAVARLLGAPPGYVGHEAGGHLTESVRRRPYQVILLDEIEKAHPDVLQAFLGVFDEGRLTDGRGRTVDFTNTVILLTSNIGAEETGASPRRRVGFGGGGGENQVAAERAVTAAARTALSPELYNRIDEVCVFAPLSRDEVKEIARRLLDGMGQALSIDRGVRLEFGEDVVDHLLDHGGFDPSLGARPMKRAIARLVEARLADELLRGDVRNGDAVCLDVSGGEIRVRIIADGAGVSAAE